MSPAQSRYCDATLREAGGEARPECLSIPLSRGARTPEEDMMSHSAALPVSGPATVSIPTISLRELAPWALFFGLLAMLVLFFVSANQGAISIPAGNAVHEWVHDGRHLLGFPCH